MDSGKIELLIFASILVTVIKVLSFTILGVSILHAHLLPVQAAITLPMIVRNTTVVQDFLTW